MVPGRHLHCASSFSTESRSRLAWLFVILVLSVLLLVTVLYADNVKSKSPAFKATRTARDLSERRLGLDFFSSLSELPPLGMPGDAVFDSLGDGGGRRMHIMVSRCSRVVLDS
jgi:hypothetical protein